MSVNPGVFGANPSFGYNSYGVNAAPALSGAALSGFGAAPASGLGYYGGYAAAAPSYGLGSYGVNPVAYSSVGYAPAAGYGYAPAAPAAGFQLDEQTVAEIESRLAYLVRRRQPVLRRQVIKVPGPGGRVQQVVRRLPTPQPDLIERVYVVKPQRDVVNLLIERPGTPPPQVQERRVVGRPHRPVIHQQVVRVAPRTQFNQAQPLANYGYASQPAVVNYAGYQPAAAPVAAYQPYSYSASYDNFSDAGYGYGGYAAQPAYAYAAQPAYAYAAQPSVVAGYAAQPAAYGYAAQPAAYGYGVQPSASFNYGYAQPAGYGYGGYGAPAYSGRF